jgi:hypothetical protein
VSVAAVLLDLLDDLGVHATEAESQLDRGGVELHTVTADKRITTPCAAIRDAADKGFGVLVGARADESSRLRLGMLSQLLGSSSFDFHRGLKV